METSKTSRKGFTLIELLIVVLIIAILAAIAVPNFLEFQTRAKISRVKSDQRNIATAIEAYMVDNNEYPQSAKYFGDTYFSTRSSSWHPVGFVTHRGGCWTVTTPISYISTWPSVVFPFNENSNSSSTAVEWLGKPDVPMPYVNVFRWATGQMPSSPRANDLVIERNLDIRWMVYTPGPKGKKGGTDGWFYEPRNNGFPTFLKPYDPTNGTISSGSIYRYGPGDRSDFKDLDY